jgi:pantoate--beta-alanine ligase
VRLFERAHFPGQSTVFDARLLMQLIHTTADLRDALAAHKTERKNTVLVPTMGNLHAGHISLIDLAKQHGETIISSIFVNPLQFGVGEDFGRYPRTLQADCAQLEAAGCDIVFAPDAAEVYPQPQSFIVQPPLADELCGAFRPGHFAGVCTVVLKLFNMVQPTCAVFGKKDYQQLFILKGMVRQLNLPIQVLAGETGRAEDGLALSSRNGYLSATERLEAVRLNRTLQMLTVQLKRGAHPLHQLEQSAAADLTEHGWRVDYISVRNQHTLLPPGPQDRDLVVLGAAHLGNTRLIDNLEFSLPG